MRRFAVRRVAAGFLGRSCAAMLRLSASIRSMTFSRDGPAVARVAALIGILFFVWLLAIGMVW